MFGKREEQLREACNETRKRLGSLCKSIKKEIHTNLLRSLCRRHGFDLFAQSSPIICMQFRIFDSFLTPVLVQLADVILAHLEEQKLVADAFFDQDTPCVLLHDRLFILM